jgi:hypothetical protein
MCVWLESEPKEEKDQSVCLHQASVTQKGQDERDEAEVKKDDGRDDQAAVALVLLLNDGHDTTDQPN